MLSLNKYSHYLVLKNKISFKISQEQYNIVRPKFEAQRWTQKITDIFSWQTLFDWRVADISHFEEIKLKIPDLEWSREIEARKVEKKIYEIKARMSKEERAILKENAFNKLKEIEKRKDVKWWKNTYMYLMPFMEKKLIRENYL